MLYPKGMKNYLSILFLLFTCSSVLMGQGRCEDESEGIFVFAKNPPKPSPEFVELNAELNSVVSQSTQGLENVDLVYVLYFVNCKGEAFEYQIAKRQDGLTARDSTSEMAILLQNYLASNVSYEPGYHVVREGREDTRHYIDYQGAFTIKVDSGVLSVLNTDETVKDSKRKSKARKRRTRSRE